MLRVCSFLFFFFGKGQRQKASSKGGGPQYEDPNMLFNLEKSHSFHFSIPLHNAV